MSSGAERGILAAKQQVTQSKMKDPGCKAAGYPSKVKGPG